MDDVCFDRLFLDRIQNDFDKNVMFPRLLFEMVFNETYPHSSVDKKRMNEASFFFFFRAQALFPPFIICSHNMCIIILTKYSGGQEIL